MVSVEDNKKKRLKASNRGCQKKLPHSVIYSVFSFLSGKNLTNSPVPAKFPRADKACAGSQNTRVSTTAVQMGLNPALIPQFQREE